MAQLFSLGIIEHFMKYIVLLSVLSLFLTACSKTPTDAQIRQRVVGTWQPVLSRSATTTIVNEMRPDGSFISKWSSATNDIELTGSWEVQGGFVTLTLTNAQGTSARSLGSAVQRYKVVRISKGEMAFQIGTDTNLTIMRRR